MADQLYVMIEQALKNILAIDQRDITRNTYCE